MNAKIFNKWDPEEIEVDDLSIKRYFNLRPMVVMHSGGGTQDSSSKSPSSI